MCIRDREAEPKEKIAFIPKQPYLTATVTTKEQYDACLRAGIKDVYFDNIIRRNQNSYEEKEGELLIGGYGGIYQYRQTNPFVTDYSFNVVNSVSCYELHRLGAKRVTLSYELNKTQIRELIDAYYKENEGCLLYTSKNLSALVRRDQRLVHFPSALVGTQNPGLVLSGVR